MRSPSATADGDRWVLAVLAYLRFSIPSWNSPVLAQLRALVPANEPVFATVSPGNIRSLRAFLAEGFQPIASEVQLIPNTQ